MEDGATPVSAWAAGGQWGPHGDGRCRAARHACHDHNWSPSVDVDSKVSVGYSRAVCV